MTVSELYNAIEGDYERAVGVLRIDKLIDKHIRKLPASEVFGSFFKAWEAKDGAALFETSHAIKGVCANLGLIKLSDYASRISDEFRPGRERKLSDDEVEKTVKEIERLYSRTVEEIKKYETDQA